MAEEHSVKDLLLYIARNLVENPDAVTVTEVDGDQELTLELRERYTIVMVTHNMQQAARISDKTAFFLTGELVEMGDTEGLFSMPRDKRTEDYITGRFG